MSSRKTLSSKADRSNGKENRSNNLPPSSSLPSSVSSPNSSREHSPSAAVLTPSSSSPTPSSSSSAPPPRNRNKRKLALPAAARIVPNPPKPSKPIQECVRAIDTLAFCAKQEELNHLLPHLRIAQSHCEISMHPSLDKDAHYSALPIHIGTSTATPSRSFYVTCGFKQGPTSAAVAVGQLIARYKPKRVISVGICGGIAGHSQLKDVVFSTSAMLYEEGKRAREGVMQYDHTKHPASESLVKVSQHLESHPQHPRKDYVVGSLLTGSAVRQVWDVFMKFEGLKLPRGATAVDMEAAAILLTSMRLGVECLVIKSVSDMAGTEKTDSFHGECMRLAGVAMLEVLDVLAMRT